MLALLAYIMLISPTCLQAVAEGATLYADLDARQWSEGNRTIEYAYDANGSLISKTTKTTSTPQQTIETITYDYNLQNRLERATTSYQQGGDTINDVTEYAYNDEGIRVNSYYYHTVNGGAHQNEETKTFLIDAYNHTGYAQVHEEKTVTTTTSTITYTIGDDVITQQTSGGTSQHLLYDGHGSTRQLANSTGGIVDAFSYDAYGVKLGGNPTRSSPATTSLLYTGEYYDKDMMQYNLRARWYDSLNGRFNQLDPYAGNNEDPQSLHKYLYCHANPVNGIDPSGEFGIALAVTLFLSADVFQSMFTIHKGIDFVNIATMLSGTPLSYESISDLTRMWTIMAIQLSGQQVSNIQSSIQTVFEMAVMYTIDMAFLAASAGLKLATIRLSMPIDAGETGMTMRLAAKAKEGANSHHIFSKRIVDALNHHPNLAGLFDRADPRLIFKAASKAAHRGYEYWHRSVDDLIVKWIEDNPTKGKMEFLAYVRKIYQSHGISERIPKVFLWNI